MSTDPQPVPPLARAAILDALSTGAEIQPDRHGAVVVTRHGRCSDEWQDMRREGWLTQTTRGTFVLSERGTRAIDRSSL